MKGPNPVPWLLLALCAVYSVFFAYPKKYDHLGQELLPRYDAPAPLVEESKEPAILEPVSGIKVLRFWDKGGWQYVSATQPDPTMNLVRTLTQSLTGR